MKANLDDIVRVNVKIKKKISKANHYNQPMQSLRGSRTFVLSTAYIHSAGTKIVLIETTNKKWKVLGHRWVSPTEEEIQAAIKSLEKKAKCNLYYLLLVSTDGEYL